MKQLSSFLAVFLLVGCQVRPTIESPNFAFIGVNVVDIQSGEIAENQIVLITGLTIVAVGSFANTVVPNDVETVFAQGQYLLAGRQSAAALPDIAFNGENRRVSANQPADLLLLDENPLQNIHALSQLAGVYSQGKWSDPNALKSANRSLIPTSAANETF